MISTSIFRLTLGLEFALLKRVLMVIVFIFTFSCSTVASSETKTLIQEEEKPMPIFKVHEIPGFNSSGLDFSPVVVGDKLIFVSERNIDLINYGETGYNKQSFLTIQYSTIKKKNDTISYSTPRLFSGRISQ